MAIALLSGPNDPSQLQNQINALIATINGYVGGVPGGPGVTVPIQTGTTGASLPTSGTVFLSTGATYTLPAPTAATLGQQVTITMISTKAATVSSKFTGGKTKMTMTTTAALTSITRFPSATLVARSTGSGGWALLAASGTIKTT